MLAPGSRSGGPALLARMITVEAAAPTGCSEGEGTPSPSAGSTAEAIRGEMFGLRSPRVPIGLVTAERGVDMARWSTAESAETVEARIGGDWELEISGAENALCCCSEEELELAEPSGVSREVVAMEDEPIRRD